MAQLLDLPNELLQDIISIIRVDDIEAFTSCNKLIRALSRDVLQRHREMKMKYSTIRCTSQSISYDSMDVRLGVHALLYEIILDGTVASYPTTLILHDGSHHRTNRSPGHHPPLEYPVSDARKRDVENQIRLKLWQCPYIKLKDMHLWIQRPPWLYFDTALSLLLSLLPNLRSIFTGGIMIYLPYTQYMLAQIAKGNQKYSDNSNPLSRLVSIDLFHEAGPEWPSKRLELYLRFTDFPSIRRIGGYDVRGRQEWTASAMAHNYPPPKAKLRNDSKITEIKFTHSNISSHSFENLFRRINALQSFEYGYYTAPIDGLSGFELSKIVGSLLANASHSLVRFDLTLEGLLYSDEYKMVYLHGQIFIGSLRGFQVLKKIRVNNTMFIKRIVATGMIGKKLCRIHRLVDLLPASTEELQLNELELVPDYPCSGIFEDFVELQPHNLPKLKALKLDYFDPVAPALKAACHEVGVDFTFIDKRDDEKDGVEKT